MASAAAPVAASARRGSLCLRLMLTSFIESGSLRSASRFSRVGVAS